MYINTPHYIHLSHCHQEKKTMRFTFISYTYWQQQNHGSISATATQKHIIAATSSAQHIAIISFIHSFDRSFVGLLNENVFDWKRIKRNDAKTEYAYIQNARINIYAELKLIESGHLFPELNRRKNKLPLIGFICFVVTGKLPIAFGHYTIIIGHRKKSRKGKKQLKAQPKNISWHFKDLKCMFAAVREHNRNRNHVEEIVKIKSTKLNKTNERNCSNK